MQNYSKISIGYIMYRHSSPQLIIDLTVNDFDGHLLKCGNKGPIAK